MGGEACRANGKCQVDGDKAVCKCKTGFLGNACQFSCPGLHHNDNACSGHGKCTLFPDTNNPVAAKCSKCLDGFVGHDCGLRCPGLGEDGNPCSGNGQCSQVKDTAQCSCKKTHKGAACNIACPVDEAGNACSNQGQCVQIGNKATCKCKEGFLGSKCQHKCPRNTKDNKVCSNRG